MPETEAFRKAQKCPQNRRPHLFFSRRETNIAGPGPCYGPASIQTENPCSVREGLLSQEPPCPSGAPGPAFPRGAVGSTCRLTPCHLSTSEQSVCYLTLNRQSTPAAASDLSLLAPTGGGCGGLIVPGSPPLRHLGPPCNHSGPPQSPSRLSPGNQKVSSKEPACQGASGEKPLAAAVTPCADRGHTYRLVSSLHKHLPCSELGMQWARDHDSPLTT